MNKRLRLSILTAAVAYDDYADPSPDFAVMYFSLDDIKEIRKILTILRENKLNSATSFSLGGVGYYENPVDGCDIHETTRVEANDIMGWSGEVGDEDSYVATAGELLYIHLDGTVSFEDFLKHTSIKLATDRISIKDLESCLSMTLDDAPKHLEVESTMVKNFAAKLLKGG
jgi:hypothetical protein